MRDAEAFRGTAFLGLTRTAKWDPYRLELFGQQLAEDEVPLALLTVHGGTLIVTDRRVLQLRAHLEVHGAWNVKEFQGYAIGRSTDIGAVRDVAHSVRPSTGEGSRHIDDTLVLMTEDGPEEILVSRGPESSLPEDEFRALRDFILGLQPK